MQFIKKIQIKRLSRLNHKDIKKLREEIQFLQDIPSKAKEADELMNKLKQIEKRVRATNKECERLGIFTKGEKS